jgi:hypothetical protein
MKQQLQQHLLSGSALATLAASALPVQTGSSVMAEDWTARAIAPVANPIFFESPLIQSEVRPIFIQHNIPDDFLKKELGLAQGTGGDVQVYALQLRWAITERLALIATKDGYIDFNPDRVLAPQTGWADLAAGLKYAVIDDKENQFILTPGFTFTIPTGDDEVFQGDGDGEWNLFVSAAKGWKDFHATGNAGLRLPNDTDDETPSLHYSLQLDYYSCQYFIPFVVLNGFTVLDNGAGLPLETEGYDLINFGSSNASGWSGLLLGGGFRSRPHQNVDLGFAYEKAVGSPEGLYDDRFTVDLVWRF